MENKAKKRNPKSEWGMEVAIFCLRHGITQRQLAEMADVRYDTLIRASAGTRAGHQVKREVQRIMDQMDGTQRI